MKENAFLQRLFLCCSVLVLLGMPSFSAAAESAVYDVGIVTDGDTARDRALRNLFRQEITVLAEGEFTVRFPPAMQLSGNDTARGVNAALDRVLADPEVDLVLALGVIASNEAFRRPVLSKPVVAPYVLERAVQIASEQKGASRPANLAWIDSLLTLDKEIMTFRKLVRFNNLALLLDRRDVESLPELSRFARRLANEHTMNVNIVPAGDKVDEILAAIPAGTEAVMVGPLYHLDQQKCRELIGGLVERKLPGFAIGSRQQVEMGLLAGDMPADIEENLARRTAVVIKDILLGEQPATLNVSFARGYELTINMATARALDIYPSLATMVGADLLNEQPKDIDRHLTLSQAVQEALEANLDLSAAELLVRAGEYAVDEARAPLLPQVNASTGIRAIDEDRAGLGRGSNPERAWTGTLGGYQQIYSEKGWAGYEVEQHNQKARTLQRDTVRLDIIHQAAVAYLNVLRAETIEQLYKDNLKLTQANLDRARIRMTIGVAGPDEVYRWETKFANDRFGVLEKESLTLDARQALNRILHRPVQEAFVAEETDLGDPLLIVGDRLFFQLMNNPRNLRMFREFSTRQALSSRPELQAMDATIAALQRQAKAVSRQFWLPEFSLEGQVDQYFSEDGAGQRGDFEDSLDDTDWMVGIFARLPLYEGGGRRAALNRLRQEIARLQTERKAAGERVVQEVMLALNRTRASYPGISLSREAADAAHRNLQLIIDSYVQGIKSIMELLDAQNQTLTADLAAANAVYNFLIDLMGVQRAMGEFVLFLPEDQRSDWIAQVREYLHQKTEQ